MDDQTVEILSDKCEVVPNQDSQPSIVLERDIVSDKFEGYSELTDETTMSNGIQDASLDQGQTLPILQKVINLSTQIQDLKREHATLSDQVKLTTSSFPDPAVLNSLQLLSTDYELLKKKYIKDSSERKRLYNEVIELKGNIRVFCRCRPINQYEVANGCNSVIEYDSSVDNELQVICSDSSKKQFKFDHVFRPEDNQEAVFAQTKPIVTSVLDGYNVCIFAYGQTGTGKTFTMEGTPENRGVNYRTVEELFRISQERGGVMRYELFVSMLEVYNEKIRDLLVDNSNQQTKKLEIKQATDGTQEVPGLVEAHVFGIENVWELLKSGSRVRSVGSTSLNEMSSRSHCLLRVTVKGENLINGQRTRSHLWLVDLAGSERIGRIEVEGERLKESQFINKSLSALGDVISALASKTTHVPYRNSKLTHMLQSSLGGDCKTLMFVQVSPSSSDLGETLCSLNFASRVRGIESGPARKQTDLTELFKYKQMAEKFKHDEKETKKLQESLQSCQLRLAAREQVCRNLQEKVRDLENQLAEERKARLKQESRALAAASAPSSSTSSLSLKQVVQKTATDKKPPLAPNGNKLRIPLRRITNFLPPPSPLPPLKETRPFTSAADCKENIPKMGNRRPLQARRISIATVRPPPLSSSTTSQGLKPKRRVSIATFRPEPNCHLTTPLHTSASRFKNGGAAAGRFSMMRDPRKARYSRLFSPLPEMKTVGGETTPFAVRSSKFMGSPPTLAAGSNIPRHHHPGAVIALQRKPLVWSPFKLRGMKPNRRPSLLASRSSTNIQ
ncbi:kinesin-like protein KIN-14S isoform X1 [Morus notabilis]|uniref:kinesin-like protein KIN-14S isoform X1 n=1 Tax=Morus notabilis TaxID=981085 RepID=UPI000CED2ECD|nr:kinesin-like protein KIN-14S isoform X1 [Morus notabilis]